ncbi:MAG: DUF721 domain-containing protein [Actinobacteria bacterium]|nr:DUF721 domain-containing protein [Actinomycetota bacterium]
MTTGADRISNIIDSYILEHKLSSKLKSYSLFNHWEEIVGREIAKNTKPRKLRDKVLYISTINPIWAGELSLMSQKIIDKINNYLKEDIVSTLRIKPDLQME